MFKVKSITKDHRLAYKVIDNPNFHHSGNIRGMKDKYYGEDARLVRCAGYIYNIPIEVYNLI